MFINFNFIKNKRNIFTLFIVFFIISGNVFAQSDQIIGLLKGVMIDPDKWLNSVRGLIQPGIPDVTNVIDLPALMKNLGILLLITGIVWGGLKIASTGSGMELKDFFVRLLISSALVFGGTDIGTWLQNTWHSSYEWGLNSIAKPKIDQASEKIKFLALETGAITLLAATAPVIISKINIGNGQNAADAQKNANETAEKSIASIGNIIQFVLGALTTIVGTYYMVVIMSGFSIMIASMLIPLSGAMVIFAGGASNQWFNLWFRSVSGALIMVLFIPVVFSAALDFGFVQPADNFNQGFKSANDKAKTGMATLTQLPASVASGNVVQTVQQTFSGVGDVIQSLGQTLTAATVGFAASIIMLIIGVIFSVVIVYAAQSHIMNFVGGTFSGGKEGGAELGAQLQEA
jgi:hypothetical protein